MGAAANGAKGGYTRRGSRRKSSYTAMSDINVTPLVDVMLVLLIVFMVAAPLMTVGVPIELPQTKAKPLQGDIEPITLSINSQGQIFLQNTETELETLVPKLEAIAQNGYDERIYVRGDTGVSYGAVMKVMGALNQAGYRKIGLVTGSEPEQKKAEAR